jgi:hypothetical protein
VGSLLLGGTPVIEAESRSVLIVQLSLIGATNVEDCPASECDGAYFMHSWNRTARRM